MTGDLSALQKTINYRFNDESLLVVALTHKSVSGNNNERLEFLGDSILNFAVADILYSRFPNLAEGDLSRMRAALVNKEALAEIGGKLAIGQYLGLGEGELKTGGHRRASIIADALEAIVGAIYLDSGMPEARNFISENFEPSLAELPEPEALKDPKTRLQEHVQARGAARPLYKVIEQTGADHDKSFLVECRLPEFNLAGEGKGSSRRAAEQQAARNVLEKLEP